MARKFSIVAVILVSMASGYGAWYLHRAQSAEQVCRLYPAGTRIADPQQLPDNFFLTRMGPLAIDNDPSRQRIILCEAMTMCDTSCTLEIEDGIVKSARFSAL